MLYLGSIWFVICVLIYSIGLYVFGGYIRLIEILDIFNCFLCKELNKLEPVYDYIVVGCGSAGSVTALRLAANKGMTVLVLEAGPHGSKLLDIPALGPVLHLSSVDWQYRTVPQKHASKGFFQQASNWPMGRIVGGTGRLNNMIYLRGHPTDYYEWFNEDKNFNYVTDILNYFKKAEDHRGAYKNDTRYHSSDGPLVVEDLPFVSPLAPAVLEAAKILKYPIRDLNGKNNTGFMQTQVNINFGDRWTPAYYLFQQNKPNLVLQTNTVVTKVLLKSNFEAYAVKYLHLGQTSTVRARKGIILSAGVVGTPKLLMLSGIGPQEHLNELGIKTKINLPVGNNLQDHVTTGLDLITLNTSLGLDLNSVLSPTAISKYFYDSSGPWTTPGCEVIGLIDTDSESYCYEYLDSLKIASMSRIKESRQSTDFKSDKKVRTKISKVKPDDMLDRYLPAARRFRSPRIVRNTKYDISIETCPINATRQPNLQFMVLPMGISTDGGNHFRKAIGISDGAWKNYFASLIGKTAISILPIVLHPKSRGTVRLSDKNIYSKPLIDPNYLSDPYDVEVLLKGINLIKRFIDTEPLQRLGAKLNDQKFPGCERFVFDTPGYWECYVRHLTVTSFHPGGTCKMGSDSDTSAVVDYNFRVHYTHKLFVADASIMPTLPSGNINAAIVMIGEKAAAKIENQFYLNSRTCCRREIFSRRKRCKVK